MEVFEIPKSVWKISTYFFGGWTAGAIFHYVANNRFSRLRRSNNRPFEAISISNSTLIPLSLVPPNLRGPRMYMEKKYIENFEISKSTWKISMVSMYSTWKI